MRNGVPSPCALHVPPLLLHAELMQFWEHGVRAESGKLPRGTHTARRKRACPTAAPSRSRLWASRSCTLPAASYRFSLVSEDGELATVA
jgi:hypothetical protein